MANPIYSPQRGTVADRIRAFQDVQPLETRVPIFIQSPRVLAQARDPGVSSGQCRRKDSSFAAPAGRASRDGNEGACEDGRPPVASVLYKELRHLEEMDQRGACHNPFPERPFTSMDDSANDHGVSRRATEADDRIVARRPRSMENITHPASEITTARSRLRSVVANKKEEYGSPRSRAYTLAELGHMLDDAIEDSSSRPEAQGELPIGDLRPKPGFVIRRSTSRKIRRQSQSRSRVPLQSTESVVPRSSEDSMRVDYEGQQQPRLPKKDVGKDPQEERPAADPNQQRIIQQSRELSPVKQRAAMFESLTQKSSGHDEICQHFQHRLGASHDGHHPPHKETRKIHRIKFGDTVEERPGTPLIALTLPQIVRKEKTNRPSSAMRTGQEDRGPSETVAEESAADDVFKDKRKTSVSWPFTWSIFNKSTYAPSQEVEPQPTAVEEKDEHYPTPRPSLVRSKVRGLLQAANEKEEAEKERRQFERERLSRKQSRAPSPEEQTEPKDDKAEAEDSKSARLPALQIPRQGKAEDTKLSAGGEENQAGPKTPLHRAMTEKQVFAPPDLPEAMEDSNASPRKSAPPRTPARGRSRKSVHRLSVGDQQHAVEQHFNLSPGPSRSGSKNRGVKVEVEVRDSPEREARDRGDKIVIVRANVAGMGDEET